MKIKIFLKNIGKGILAPLKWTLKIIKQIPGLLGEKPILTAAIVLIIIGFIVFRITMSIEHEENSFIGNIIAEGYGVVFDIFVFGILIAFFNLIGEKRRDIRRWKEEIDDFRYWENDEAKFRIVGNIKRLNKTGVFNIKLTNCYLKGATLEFVNLRGANLVGANLKGAILMQADLRGANLKGADLEGAALWETNLEGADLWHTKLCGANLWKANLVGAKLDEADLRGANLAEADLDGANLEWANLAGANLRGTKLWCANLRAANLKDAIFNVINLKQAKDLSLDQLLKAKTLYLAKLDPELEAQVKEKFPHLLEEPQE